MMSRNCSNINIYNITIITNSIIFNITVIIVNSFNNFFISIAIAESISIIIITTSIIIDIDLITSIILILIIKDYKSIELVYKPGIKIDSSYQITDIDNIGYRVIDELGRNYWYTKECFEPIEETRDKLINELLRTRTSK